MIVMSSCPFPGTGDPAGDGPSRCAVPEGSGPPCIDGRLQATGEGSPASTSRSRRVANTASGPVAVIVIRGRGERGTPQVHSAMATRWPAGKPAGQA